MPNFEKKQLFPKMCHRFNRGSTQVLLRINLGSLNTGVACYPIQPSQYILLICVFLFTQSLYFRVYILESENVSQVQPRINLGSTEDQPRFYQTHFHLRVYIYCLNFRNIYIYIYFDLFSNFNCFKFGNCDPIRLPVRFWSSQISNQIGFKFAHLYSILYA